MRDQVGERRRFRRFIVVLAATATVSVLAPATHAGAALTVQDLDNGASADGLAQELAGQGVSISNVVYTGSNDAAGLFGGGDGIIGFNSGIILNSGKSQTEATDSACSSGVEGPNDCHEDAGSGSGSAGGSNTTAFGLPGDPDLTAASGFETFDASILEFDFIPASSQAQFNYVFSSEEYSDYSNTSFNDVFAFFVNGSNCATVPTTGEPVTINTINNGNDTGGDATPHNPEFFVDNVRPAPSLDTQMDGLTTVLTCTANVLANQSNHMKLAIADASDSALDSAVFLETASLTSPGSNLVVELSGRKKQKPVGPSVPPKGKIKNAQRKLLSVKVTCLNEACNVTLSGNAKAGGEKVKLQQQQISLQGGELRKLRLPATSRNDLAALKAALKDGAKGKAKVKATATNSAGQPVGDNLSVKLRG